MKIAALTANYSSSQAIVIGINDYANTGHLYGAANDAKSIADLMETELGFEPTNIHLLLDGDATQYAIREQLELVADQSLENDRIFFFFAGHGETRQAHSGHKLGYICTVESTPGKWHTFLPFRDIMHYAELMAAKHAFFVFDACFSGLAFERAGMNAAAAADLPGWLTGCLTHRVRQLLTAGLSEQTVGDSTDDGHSIFTSYLIKALRGAACGSEGEMTASQVMAYVADRVMKDGRSKQKPAYGNGTGSEPGGDFVFRQPLFHAFRVPADREGGINTGILVKAKTRLSITGTSVISYDSGHHYTNPDGFLCTYTGRPLAHEKELKPMTCPHADAYKTDGGRDGIVGSLFAWIGEYSAESAYFIGEKREFEAQTEGYLHFSVNDARGAYEDNRGEFEVTIRIF